MDDAYSLAIDYLHTADPVERRRKKHRLPAHQYALSDCEFFFTICARHQGEPFTNPALAQAIVDALLWRKQQHRWLLYCYCLMPDHLHFVMGLASSPDRTVNAGARGTLPESVLDHIARFKSYTTSQVWWKHGGRGPLWQHSSYDRAIRCDDTIEAAALYVLNNPVRRGLVSDWEAYPYSAVVDGWL